jgi:hypothetical protein
MTNSDFQIFLTILLATLICFGFFISNRATKTNINKAGVASSVNVGVDLESKKFAPTPSNDIQSKEFDTLKNAVLELTKQLKFKEKEIEVLHAKVSEKDFRRIFSRLVSMNENLAFVTRLLEQEKLSRADAAEQIRSEISSVVYELGMEVHSITPGTPVSSLPFGSFEVVGAVSDAPNGLAGKVKEVVSQGFYIRGENEKIYFISPSKITAYKL